MNQHLHKEGLCVVDFGSQYTHLIARKLREHQIYCECVSPVEQQPQFGYKVSGVILSGGPDSVAQGGARVLPPWVMSLQVPVLGICYGMQLLVEYFGGEVGSGQQREYGATQIASVDNTELSLGHGITVWKGFKHPHQVWMSHGDHIITLPQGFVVVARSARAIAACMGEHGRVIGLQYHPEVEHTHRGADFLAYFARQVCEIASEWQPSSMLAALRADLTDQLNEDDNLGRILVACSGGVDSTVTLVLLTQIFGKQRVHGVFVNTGLLRIHDLERMEILGTELDVSLEVIPAEDVFYQRLKEQADPEAKRRIIGATFIDVFSDYSQSHQDAYGWLAQGTLYSDVIESGGGGANPRLIKTHHNVGGLPEVVPFKILEPLRALFKDEVRQLGQELGIPHAMLWQHPFPGPGLGVRIVGAVDAVKVKLLQQADKIYIDYLIEHQLYDQIWQAFCVLLPVKSVGVMGDRRTYEWVVSLRAITSTDAMTAQVADISIKHLSQVAERIVAAVSGINRVLYDVTTKPPATIEWE